jgi:RNA polymerase sigma-54 factor
MTPQLQQAIRLLQLPTIELQAHIREALETTSCSSWSRTDTAFSRSPPRRWAAERRLPTTEVEVVGEGERAPARREPLEFRRGRARQEFADGAGATLRETCLQLDLLHECSGIDRPALIDAINDDGYLTDSPMTSARPCTRNDASAAELAAMAACAIVDPVAGAAA